jgi:hypothetical protein
MQHELQANVTLTFRLLLDMYHMVLAKSASKTFDYDQAKYHMFH